MNLDWKAGLWGIPWRTSEPPHYTSVLTVAPDLFVLALSAKK
jgi:hypothetical protein